jgi:hypothetical protein
LNCWNIAEASTSYVWNSEHYQGKRNRESEIGLYRNIVLRLSDPLKDKGHHIYMDNLFSSPASRSQISAVIRYPQRS